METTKQIQKMKWEKRGWFSGSHSKDGLRDLLSGMISGFVCKIVEYPLDTVKVLQQTSGKSALDCLQGTYGQGGVRALYQGLSSPLIGAMAENATLFVAYSGMKKALNVNDNPTLTNPVPMYKYLVAGGGSGIFSAFVLTPVELVKCRLQIQQGGGAYKGPVDVIVKTIRSDGIQGLWKGNLSCLAREIPGNIAWFGTYEVVKRGIQKQLEIENLKDVPLGYTAFSGACAGVMYWAVPYPADTVKSRIQTDARFSELSFGSALRRIVATEGLGALYKGLGITCIRAAPSHALIFYFYEVSSTFLEQV